MYEAIHLMVVNISTKYHNKRAMMSLNRSPESEYLFIWVFSTHTLEDVSCLTCKLIGFLKEDYSIFWMKLA
jgi:hypothetical protein